MTSPEKDEDLPTEKTISEASSNIFKPPNVPILCEKNERHHKRTDEWKSLKLHPSKNQRSPSPLKKNSAVSARNPGILPTIHLLEGRPLWHLVEKSGIYSPVEMFIPKRIQNRVKFGSPNLKSYQVADTQGARHARFALNLKTIKILENLVLHTQKPTKALFKPSKALAVAYPKICLKPGHHLPLRFSHFRRFPPRCQELGTGSLTCSLSSTRQLGFTVKASLGKVLSRGWWGW